MTSAIDHRVARGRQEIRDDPAGFFRLWFGADPWDKQVEIAESVRDHRRTAVKSCHGSGKSWTAARLVLWYLHAHENSVVITTAPTNNQVENILWRELRSAAVETRSPLAGQALQVRYEIAPDWYAIGFKSGDTRPDRFAGFHASSGHALVVIDEAAGVVPAVYEALDAVMAAQHARMLLIGNPTVPRGVFYDAFHKDRTLYNLITIAAHDTPNFQGNGVVRPYLITPEWVQDAITRYGPDSPYVLARVHAQFPEQATDSLFWLSWLEAARYREPVDYGGVRAGLDVAGGGRDETVLAIMSERGHLFELWAWSSAKPEADVLLALSRWRSRLMGVNIDAGGIGHYLANQIEAAGFPVQRVQFGATSPQPATFADMKAYLYWTLRTRLEAGEIAGLTDDELIHQASTQVYETVIRHGRGVIAIPNKDQQRKLTGRSPDRLEALALAATPIIAPSATPPSPSTTIPRVLSAQGLGTRGRLI